MINIGIEDITSYVPDNRISNSSLMEKFEIDSDFIDNKIGFSSVSKMSQDESVVSMSLVALRNLIDKNNLDLNTVDVLILVTQNPDMNIPHNSSIIHNELGMSERCMCFDISQGCAGYIYGLATIKSIMQQLGFKKGLLVTCDPYSKVIDDNDKNTSLLFGDGATATLLSENFIYEIGEFEFGAVSSKYEALKCLPDEKLFMNGREIFNFASRSIPAHLNKLLIKNNLNVSDIDLFAMHQGSKYIIDTLKRRLRLDDVRVPFVSGEYGNLVSSSIPDLLTNYIKNDDFKRIICCGFGVGLSYGGTYLQRRN